MKPAYLPSGWRPIIALSTFIFLYGCTSVPDAGGSDYRDEGGIGTAPPVATVVDARPAALLDGKGLLWGDLRDALSEAGGAEVLRETVIDRRAARACADAEIIITDNEISAEQARLLRTLSNDDDVALRLLDQLRRSQRLGPVRYRNLLKRNASLRALVRDDVDLNETAIGDMFDMLHGPKRRARLITTGDLRSAELARTRIEAGAAFAEIAAEVSTDDPSAARGGLLEPISRRDPSYPIALRRAVWSLAQPGEVSPPILLETGSAIVQFVEELPGDDGVTLESERERVTDLVRLAQERMLMDELARGYLRDTRVKVYDNSLHEAWVRSW